MPYTKLTRNGSNLNISFETIKHLEENTRVNPNDTTFDFYFLFFWWVLKSDPKSLSNKRKNVL